MHPGKNITKITKYIHNIFLLNVSFFYRAPSINALLPLFHEKSTSISMIMHGMKLVRDLTQYLNGNQTPVMCLDQQLYVLAKKIQWNFPANFAENKFVVLLGPLHIEQSFLRVLGSYIEGSGWSAILSHSGICTSGSAEALLKVNFSRLSCLVFKSHACVNQFFFRLLILKEQEKFTRLLQQFSIVF